MSGTVRAASESLDKEIWGPSGAPRRAPVNAWLRIKQPIQGPVSRALGELVESTFDTPGQPSMQVVYENYYTKQRRFSLPRGHTYYDDANDLCNAEEKRQEEMQKDRDLTDLGSNLESHEKQTTVRKPLNFSSFAKNGTKEKQEGLDDYEYADRCKEGCKNKKCCPWQRGLWKATKQLVKLRKMRDGPLKQELLKDKDNRIPGNRQEFSARGRQLYEELKYHPSEIPIFADDKEQHDWVVEEQKEVKRRRTLKEPSINLEPSTTYGRC
mgnify:CR=1 FL=1